MVCLGSAPPRVRCRAYCHCACERTYHQYYGKFITSVTSRMIVVGGSCSLRWNEARELETRKLETFLVNVVGS
jgi:hypothetical protein